eukprot:CAMPEP_0172606178 /NCGR_PEP_ID=MMETSP1068-20121228/26369_1 /TAXON_ID=35684 /ORGANISM="Pseudopedinella elastica, Strain CCMP716" /LENGTH=507 /DNA_ID=CAMNT_0013408813 /DNA_START=10 /DNA_END=1535 /DNA_ORIENTATION=-
MAALGGGAKSPRQSREGDLEHFDAGPRKFIVPVRVERQERLPPRRFLASITSAEKKPLPQGAAKAAAGSLASPPGVDRRRVAFDAFDEAGDEDREDEDEEDEDDGDLEDPAYSRAAAAAEEASASRGLELAVWRKVSDYFKALAKKESLSVRGLFQELDLNGDNTVSLDEFVKVLKIGGVSFEAEELTALLRELDPNDDRVIYYGEFSRALRSQRKVLKMSDQTAAALLEANRYAPRQSAAQSSKVEGARELVFRAGTQAKINEAARRDAKEEKRLRRQSGGQSPLSRARSPKGNRGAPTAQTSATSVADFDSVAQWFRDPGVPRGLKRLWRQIETYVDARHELDGAKLVTMFREFDRSGRGALEPSMLRSALVRAGVHFSDGDFALFMAEVDSNGDGLIQFSEFANSVLGHHETKMKTTKVPARRALMELRGPVRRKMSALSGARAGARTGAAGVAHSPKRDKTCQYEVERGEGPSEPALAKIKAHSCQRSCPFIPPFFSLVGTHI